MCSTDSLSGPRHVRRRTMATMGRLLIASNAAFWLSIGLCWPRVFTASCANLFNCRDTIVIARSDGSTSPYQLVVLVNGRERWRGRVVSRCVSWRMFSICRGGRKAESSESASHSLNANNAHVRRRCSRAQRRAQALFRSRSVDAQKIALFTGDQLKNFSYKASKDLNGRRNPSNSPCKRDFERPTKYGAFTSRTPQRVDRMPHDR